LDQDLRDPEIVRGGLEHAIERYRHVCTERHRIPRAKLPVIALYPVSGENRGRPATAEPVSNGLDANDQLLPRWPAPATGLASCRSRLRRSRPSAPAAVKQSACPVAV